MDFDIGPFITRYFIDPIIYGDGYNPVNTLTYAIILGISLFAVLKLMALLKVRIDERLIIATSPYILLGASMRVLEDVKIFSPPLSYLFITPFIYFLAFFVTAAILITCIVLERRGMIKDFTRPFFAVGIAGILIVLAELSTKQVNAWWWAPIVIFALAFTFTAIIYLIAQYFKLCFLTMPLNVAILGAHMFDASSTFTAIDIVTGFSEKHVVPVFFISMTNTAFVMYALKLAVFIPVIYIIEKYFKDDADMYYILKFALLVLGFGPGIRNTLELTFI